MAEHVDMSRDSALVPGMLAAMDGMEAWALCDSKTGKCQIRKAATDCEACPAVAECREYATWISALCCL